MNQKGSSDVWVFAEQRDGELHDVSLELLGKASELASQAGGAVVAVLMGHQVRELAQILVNHGAHIVFVADDPRLEQYRLLPVYACIGEPDKETRAGDRIDGCHRHGR